MDPSPAGTIVFLFTDVEGSTQLWEQHPNAMWAALARHNVLLREVIESHRGVVFKTWGDQFCAWFPQAADALGAAIAAQQQLRALPPAELSPQMPAASPKLPEPEKPRELAGLLLKVRIALHAGPAERYEQDYFGPTLNRIARLLAVAHGGQVLLSRTAFELVRAELPAGVSMLDLGSHRLRDLREPERVYQVVHPELPADFPPLLSLSPLSHNLPQQTTRFVGREREMATAQKFLATSRLLTLTGTGGIGKTRLSLHVAAELLPAYEDGVWLVELAALADPSLVAQAVAVALAVREEPGKPLAQTLVEQLQSRQLLLLLDNCEHLLPACADLVHLLLRFCPSLRVLATSREPLNIPGEQIYRVPSLTAPDPRHLPRVRDGEELVAALTPFEAVQMFLDRAGLVRSTFVMTPENAPLVALLCHRLDGIPLVIELAAACLRLLSIEQLALRLDDMFRLLTGGSRVALPRQQTLRLLIDWSYDLLDEAQQTLFRRLSVFAGGFTLEAVEGVCVGEIIERDQALGLLGQLVEKSLVWAEEEEAEPRYRLLEPIRQYASEKLWNSGEGAPARFRLRNWLMRWCERKLLTSSGPDRAVWLQRLVREYDNLRAALGPAARTHPPTANGTEQADLPLLPARLVRWGQVIEQLVPAYRHLSRSEAALGIVEDYLALCGAEGNAEWLARAYTLLGIFHRLNPHLAGQQTSRASYEKAIAVCEASGLEDWAPYPRLRLAHDLALDGIDLERAEALVRACPPEADAGRDVLWLASSRSTLAPTICCTHMWIATHRADWEALKSAFQQSLEWGGPNDTTLRLLLARIEETCRRRAEETTYRDLCRFMTETYHRFGLEPPLQQWYQEPAQPVSRSDEPWIDERFDGEQWHPALRWQDATGRSRVDRDSRPGWLGLYPPEGCNLWPETDLDAPRLLVTVQGDFVAQTRVELERNVHVLAGLLVWVDPGHFARLELQRTTEGSDSAGPVLEVCTEGRFRPIARGEFGPATMWLRIERIGDELRGMSSQDGERWLGCGVVRLPRRSIEQVGLAVVPHGSGSCAWFDTFTLWGDGSAAS